ncbi:GNAT family N-acetyltransferase [Pseudomonas sp. CDFA 602]|uniref:GNAT family N-acetyltransferase n=1 Tax=Pseudomonas californiensis TaxID=2829823 RepID=UPI001E2DF357|nr:GNAT family N-acetyltransferase [Pseudomonas californiensis]MCD5995183.1 GNAT family N-acetyltransferase [Pseudomonas californiensis]MCD6000731.1 GNAT family N-acetyltransferase [Pseudomonas californiensis]
MDTLRPYALMDRDACLHIFDTNTPHYFDPSEREKFANFLLAPLGEYFVAQRNGETLGCGGFLVLTDSSLAELTWGMVDSHHHGKNLGRFLTLARLELMKSIPGVISAYINTSQHVQGFYAGLGFAVNHIETDAHGSGIDSVKMSMTIGRTPLSIKACGNTKR